jgi:hypothetical protein|tara:strand:+ start:265 stop:543 length:279 start_codon:yes stop_codon:yes gene_type:complete
MKTQTKAVKKKAVKSLPRESIMSKSDKEKSIDEIRQRRHRQLAYDSGYSDGVKRVRGYYYQNQIAVARKRARDSEREVVRLNALVIKLAEKL